MAKRRSAHTCTDGDIGSLPSCYACAVAQLCEEKSGQLIAPLRAVCRENGYALLVHGSLRRDIDLVAVPWIDGAATHEALVAAIVACVERINGTAIVSNGATVTGLVAPIPEWKPHGRRCWSIHLGGGPYIDLSVMPLEPLHKD